MIPKIIHFCWFGNNPYPDKIQECIDTWKKNLPDYEIRRWDESTFDLDSNKWVRQAYDCGKYAFVADFVRFHALFEYGGIYLDTDMEVLRPFPNNLFSFGLNLSIDDFGYIDGAFMASEKGHPIIGALIKGYINQSFIKEDGSMNLTVINAYMQELLKPYGYKIMPHMQTLDDCGVKLFSSDYFNCRSLYTGKVRKTENSYLIHWHTILWASRKVRLVQWIRFNILVPVLGVEGYRKLQSLFNRDSVKK